MKLLTPRQAGRVIGHNKEFVVRLIEAKELVAEDHRQPGAERPRYMIDPDDLANWKESRRTVKPAVSRKSVLASLGPVIPGLLR